MEHITISTTHIVAGHNITKTLGLVQGNTVRSRNIIRNVVANIRTIFGGEIVELTQAVTHSREEALNRMLKEASLLQADAVVGVHFVTTDIGQQCSEILAYGTAVKCEKV